MITRVIQRKRPRGPALLVIGGAVVAAGLFAAVALALVSDSGPYDLTVATKNDLNKQTLGPGGAIVEYIVHRHGAGRLAPRPDDPAYARYLYWLHFAEGSLMSLMLIALVLSRVPEAAASPVTSRIGARVTQMLAFVDTELGSGPWFAGAEFTAADVMMAFPFTTMRHFLNVDVAPYPNLTAYLARIASRPAYQKAMTLAGPRTP